MFQILELHPDRCLQAGLAPPPPTPPPTPPQSGGGGVGGGGTLLVTDVLLQSAGYSQPNGAILFLALVLFLVCSMTSSSG